MIKEKYIELVQWYVSGGGFPADLRSRLSGDFVNSLASLAFEQMVSEIEENAAQNNNFSEFNQFIKPYALQVTREGNKYYSELPVAIIRLPNDGGIRDITPTGDEDYAFVYSDNIRGKLYKSQETEIMSARPKYYIEGQRVYYRRMNPNYKEVEAKLLRTLDSYDDTEDVGIPSKRAADIFRIITQLLMTMYPEKKTVDGANTNLTMK